MPFAAVVVAPFSVSAPPMVVLAPSAVSEPVIVVDALIVDDAVAKNPPEKVWRLLQAFVVVVPNASDITPVSELYCTGYVPEIEVLEILLLKVAKSAEERYPFCEPLACWIESVEPANASGEAITAVWSALAPLPTNRPESVVEPVPPPATVSVPEILGVKVKVFPAPTMVSAVLKPFVVAVVVARVTVVPFCNCPAGPTF